MPTDGKNESALLDIAITHARSWVELHTSQRQNLLNFFLVAVAFLFSAYVSAVDARRSFLAVLIALVGVVASLVFIAMDLRNRDLTQTGEAALQEIESRLAEKFQLPALRISEAVHKPRHPLLSMGKMIRSLYAAVGIVFVVAMIYAIVA